MSDNFTRRPRSRIKPVYLYGGAAVVVAGVVIWTRRNRASAAATAAPTDTTDTSGYTPDEYSSGYAGDYSAAYGGAYGATPGLLGYYDPTTGTYIGGSGATTVTAPATNAQWAQQAIAYLTSIGYDGLTASAAIGLYLAGAGLTAAQMQTVQAAIGAEGNPPNTVPPPHVTAPPPGQSSGSTPIAGTFIRDIRSGAIYQIDVSRKMKFHVSAATWTKLGQRHERPKYTEVLPSDPRLTYKTGGTI